MGQGATIDLESTYKNLSVTGSHIAAFLSGLTAAIGTSQISSTEQGHTDGGTAVMASAGSWVTFSKTYSTAPTVVATPVGEVANNFVEIATVDTGSFQAIGSPDTGSFAWVAFG